MMYHEPVLLNECIEGLDINPKGIYVDLTFGSGGHSSEILKRLTEGKLIAFDQDSDSAINVLNDKRFIFINQNFRFFRNFLKLNKFEKVDGILADLGVSSHQIDSPKRGFSFRHDAELDMRMDNRAKISAKVLLNTYNFENLVKIFSLYGEITNSKQVANAVIKYRENAPLKTTGNLIEAIEPYAPKFSEYKFYAKVFQAIRIAVNEEIDVLKEMLLQTALTLKPNGRLVILSYHSLEDRLVKNYIKSGDFEGKQDKDMYGNTSEPFEAVNRKLIIPSEEEIERNNRARSAKLRIAQKR
ncbi:MAG: 16S rRNA (cytosine(1402)-N(4))-methyltransferase [Bacteroidetes bacterium GWF2_33_38]|nr:MAG: 16S rRNA (cytosine(1402)-N(4))-methyltransferase [Bacteroidetes bacterium GWF2_33_38]OFY73500.1 MAG: 16S rRNA (cytosine(1402)-N(4))-methyltransferase [Bacteroidetes bacterium RIFOXYA12_FULL_33_9]OFY88928.1 MAG: 16S rRNA (cytosine(1402)-N(4))-methyltransferase [Bacteroidetes bacterium RIFOXYA2_FULL_33_7]